MLVAVRGERGEVIAMRGPVVLFALLSAVAALLFVGSFATGVDEGVIADTVAGIAFLLIALAHARAAVECARPRRESPARLRQLAGLSVACIALAGGVLGPATQSPVRAITFVLVLIALFGGIPLLIASALKAGMARPAAKSGAGPPGESPALAMRRLPRWPFVAAALIALFMIMKGGVQDKVDAVGGKWVIVWKRGMLPEAGGGPWRMLHRRTLTGTRQVDELLSAYRYLGDDCIVYVTYYTTRVGLRAACGDNPPIVLSDEKSGIDWYAPNPPIGADPIQVSDTTFVSVAEVKRRANASR